MRQPLLAILLALGISGCAGVGIPATDDPAAKLREARYLYSEAGRPARAKALIQEAMDASSQAGDSTGIAMAHREYAYFLSTPGTEAIVSDGPAPADTPVAPERLRRALAEMQEASRLLGQTDHYDLLSNTSVGEARIAQALGDRAGACAALTRSLAASARQDAAVPGRQPLLPPGVASFAELIAKLRRDYGCPP
ncbi:hypothetical protein [Zavarzinia sp.]|uniref:hypothetical protein n=1 Tax=Zavarzinia sp. TaxID=2027920 RepID=UPI003566C3BE